MESEICFSQQSMDWDFIKSTLMDIQEQLIQLSSRLDRLELNQNNNNLDQSYRDQGHILQEEELLEEGVELRTLDHLHGTKTGITMDTSLERSNNCCCPEMDTSSEEIVRLSHGEIRNMKKKNYKVEMIDNCFKLSVLFEGGNLKLARLALHYALSDTEIKGIIAANKPKVLSVLGGPGSGEEIASGSKFLIDVFPRTEDNLAAFEFVTQIKPEFVLFFDCSKEEMERHFLSKNQGRLDEFLLLLERIT